MKQLGYGDEYRYAHDEQDAYAAGEDYFPDELEPLALYQPVPRGQLALTQVPVAKRNNVPAMPAADTARIVLSTTFSAVWG